MTGFKGYPAADSGGGSGGAPPSGGDGGDDEGGEWTPRQFIGSDTVKTVASHLKRGGRYPDEGESDLAKMLANEAGRDGLPTLASPSKFASIPGKPIYRGVTRPEWVESYKSGEFRATYGMADVGTYFFGGPELAAIDAAGEYGTNVIKAKLVEGSVVLQMDEVATLGQTYKAQVRAELARMGAELEGQELGIAELIKAADRLLDDAANYAIIAGIDAWETGFLSPDDQQLQYYVVINRQATVVEE